MLIIDKFLHNPSKNWRKYWAGVALYFVVGFPALYVARTYFPESSLRYALATIPIFPAFWAGWSLIQYILEQDELTRKTHTEATMLAAVALCAFTFTYGFLESFGFPNLPTLFIFPIFMLIWTIAYFFTKSKYGLPMTDPDTLL